MRNITKIAKDFSEKNMLEPLTLFCGNNEHKGWFSNFHINKKELPQDFYLYEIRHTDFDSGEPSTLEDKVRVNFFGTFICEDNSLLEGKANLKIDDWDFNCCQ